MLLSRAVTDAAPGSAGGSAGDPLSGAATATALEALVRSLAKEVGAKGSVVNGVRLPPGCAHDDAALQHAVRGPLSFLLTPDAAFVSAQTVVLAPPAGVRRPLLPPGATSLAGRVALVTGAARGIGAAIAARLAVEGAAVLAVDVPSAAGVLDATVATLGPQARALALDITAPHAAARVAEWVAAAAPGGGLDVLVHNAGITADRMLRNMDPAKYASVMAVNYAAIRALNVGLGVESFDASGGGGAARAVRDGASVVVLSSINGIAGAAGQTNYAASKGALIGYAAALAPTLAHRGITVNAVAPGFIETAMVDKMPAGPRTIGRRIAAVGQGGLPSDVAAVIAFLASDAAAGVSGQTLRVCGGNPVGK